MLILAPETLKVALRVNNLRLFYFGLVFPKLVVREELGQGF